MSPTITVTIGPWVAVYDGGRLADIWHVTITEYPVACVDVVPDYFTDEHDATRAEVRAAFRQWAREEGAEYARNLP